MPPCGLAPDFDAGAAALAATLCGLVAAAAPASAGGFAVREQSTTFLGTAFAGSAAGGDISGIFWNPAVTGALPGCNMSSSYSLILGRSDETAHSGLFVTGAPPIAPGLSPTSTDVASDPVVLLDWTGRDARPDS